MPALAALLMSALSQAALAVIAKLISKELFEDLIARLVVKAAQKLAEKSETHTDDEFVEKLAKQLGVDVLVYRKAKTEPVEGITKNRSRFSGVK